MSTESAKLIIEVTAGLVPGKPDDSFTRRWAVSSAEWEEAQDRDAADLQLQQEDPGAADHAFASVLLLAFRAAEADEYARLLRNPGRLNWVRTDWVWL